MLKDIYPIFYEDLDTTSTLCKSNKYPYFSLKGKRYGNVIDKKENKYIIHVYIFGSFYKYIIIPKNDIKVEIDKFVKLDCDDFDENGEVKSFISLY